MVEMEEAWTTQSWLKSMMYARKTDERTEERTAVKIVGWIVVRIGGKTGEKTGERIGVWIGKRIAGTILGRTQVANSADWIGPTMWPVSTGGKGERMPA